MEEENETMKELILVNQRLLLILGFTVPLIWVASKSKDITDDTKNGLEWIMRAIEKVVYQNEPLPPMPIPGKQK